MGNTKSLFNSKKIISYILSIIIVMSLTVAVILTIINATLFQKEFVKKKIESTDYINNIYNYIIENCSVQSNKYGIHESIVKEAIKKEHMENDINGFLDAIYDEKEFNIEEANCIISINEQIDRYAIENNCYESEESRNRIEEYKNNIKETYKRGILDFNDTIYYCRLVIKTIKAIIALLLIIATTTAILVYKLNKTSVGISMLAVGILLIILRIYASIKLKASAVFVFNKVFSNLLVSVINKALQKTLIIGIVFFVIGLIIICVTEIKKEYKKVLLLDTHSHII